MLSDCKNQNAHAVLSLLFSTVRHQMRSAFGLLRLNEDFLAAPDFLEVVVVAHIRLKHVNNHRSKVDEDPFSGIPALNAEDFAARFLHGA